MAREDLNKLTLEEHTELALELHRTQVRMTQLFNVLAGVYGPQSWCALAFAKVNDSLTRLSLELAAQAEADCPGAGAGNVYRTPEPPSRIGPAPVPNPVLTANS